MNRRDGTPQTFNPAGLRKRVTCGVCGASMRACNLARHARRRHDPGYVQPSRTASYRRSHRTRAYGMGADRKAYYQNAPGTLYIIHYARPLGEHASHYMGWSGDVLGRLVAHQKGLGSAFTRAAAAAGIPFALTWTRPGTRADEAALKRGRKLAELCSLCRDTALEKRAARTRAWRTAKKEAMR